MGCVVLVSWLWVGVEVEGVGGESAERERSKMTTYLALTRETVRVKLALCVSEAFVKVFEVDVEASRTIKERERIGEETKTRIE